MAHHGTSRDVPVRSRIAARILIFLRHPVRTHAMRLFLKRMSSRPACFALSALLLCVIIAAAAMTGAANSGEGNYSHIPHSRTFDVVTWNIEWFGDETRGPSDTELQYRNVVEIIDSLQPDLIGVQEIYSITQFERLIDDLDRYDGFVTRYGWGGDPDAGMDVGFIYKTETVNPTHYRLLDSDSQADLTPFYWASRLPKEFIFRVQLEDISFSARAVVVHAMARSDSASYERRIAASQEIKENYFDPYFSRIPLIFLGDYNDRVTESTYRPEDTPMPSPYRNFVDDPAYEVVTYSLDEAGEASWPGVDSWFPPTMLDHITINEPWFEYWLEGSERVYRPDYIEDYPRTTSDHYPVKVRFDVTGRATSSHPSGAHESHSDRDTAEKAALIRNHPNPFNSQTSIVFELGRPEAVTISVFNAMGERVAEPVTSRQYEAGIHQVEIDASGWASGVYLYRMDTASGANDTGLMTLIK